MNVELIDLSFQPECGVSTCTAAISSRSSGRELDPRREVVQCAQPDGRGQVASELPESAGTWRADRADTTSPILTLSSQ